MVEVRITAPHDLRIGRARVFNERALQVRWNKGAHLTQPEELQRALSKLDPSKNLVIFADF